MEEISIKESIGRYTPGIHSERHRGGDIRYKNQDHPSDFERSEKERGISESIEEVTTDYKFLNMLENCSIKGEIVSTTADLLGFS